METLSIKQFCEKFTQQKAAEIIGCSQGNISQIITENRRQVFFELKEDGTYDWYEIKRSIKTTAA